MENKEINNLVCPKCGSKNLQITTETDTQTHGKNFSTGKGCLGYLMFGPLGILCGSCGQQQKTTVTNTQYWVCPDCGNKFRNPDDIREELNQYKKKYSLSFLIFSLILSAILLTVGITVDMSALTVFASIVCIISIGGFISAKKILIPQKEKELSDIEDGMKRFK